MANVLPTHKRVAIVRALVEGNSIRATSRRIGCSKNTVTKLLVELGTACSRYMDEALRNLPCERVQCDEIWSFVGMKQKTADRQGRGGEDGVGSVWTWTAIDAETKLVPSFMVGERDGVTACAFIKDLAGRLANRVQLTTDGLTCYLEAVEEAFGGDIDYAMLIKQYGTDPEGERTYSPSVCTGSETIVVQGSPKKAGICTSYVERQNLTMRMSIRRFTRLTNAFSKKVENHAAAVALHFMAYNFVKPHGTLTKRAHGHPVTPAMEAGVAMKPWTYEEVVGLLDQGADSN